MRSGRCKGIGSVLGFRENWRRFLDVVDSERIELAQRSLQEMLEVERLCDKTFLDVGAGSGLFSLALLRLGAVRVRSFDFDPTSVRCALELRSRFEPKTTRWEITTEMFSTMRSSARSGHGTLFTLGGPPPHGRSVGVPSECRAASRARGKLYVSIYNDQGLRSRTWRAIKRRYNQLPIPLRTPYALAVMLPRELLSAAAATAARQPGAYVRSWKVGCGE